MSKNSLTTDEIDRLAHLANLRITPEENAKYQEQIGETLEYVENLKELSTENIEETHHVSQSENVNFHDGTENKRGFTSEEATKNSKNKKGSYFVVKKIL